MITVLQRRTLVHTGERYSTTAISDAGQNVMRRLPAAGGGILYQIPWPIFNRSRLSREAPG